MPATVHRIGDPENPSEAKAIRKLAEVLPENYYIFHNFEITTGQGLPYEYDIAVVGEHAVYHVEVKGYHGAIRGDQRQWVFENGGVMPSPIPLANKKTKILANKIRGHSRQLDDVWTETLVLLTDDGARVNVRDDQAHRIVTLGQAFDALTDPKRLPVSTNSIRRHHDAICTAIFGSRPSKKVVRIGLYDVIEKINQTEQKSVYLGSHRYIRTRPKTILKVYQFDIYATEPEKARQIEAIFHDQNAVRLLGVHPNIVHTGDIFAWEDNKFVLPTEYIDGGRTLEMLLEKEEDRKIKWAEKAAIVQRLASGLRHCHVAGVIHRDVRPLNVVMGPKGETKLVNFDLALIQNSKFVKDPEDMKKRLDRRYVAPEVWKDPHSATPASDVYSLGLVFYELITSQRPYEDVEQAGKVPLDRKKLLSELATPGSEDFMDSPEDAASVIEKMCAIDPKERYKSMDEVAEDLSILADLTRPDAATRWE
jgi:tRNA A-37 threonylcarbamoyl transferase component Bud32